MDYFTYDTLRTAAMEPLAVYFNTERGHMATHLADIAHGGIGVLKHEQDRAMDFWNCRDLTPLEKNASHLLAVISNHRAIAWWREPQTPDGSPALEPLTPAQTARLWSLTADAVAAFAGRYPECEAAALNGLVDKARMAQAHTQPQAAPMVDMPDWKGEAITRAWQFIEQQQARDYYPSQNNIADEIAKEFRASGVVGAGGKPLTGAYIKRHALKGISSESGKQLSTTSSRGKQGK